jgi:alpha-L-arabinofuranosidase
MEGQTEVRGAQVLKFGLATTLILCLAFNSPASETPLSASQSAEATIEIDASKSSGNISPLLYGQFAEPAKTLMTKLTISGAQIATSGVIESLMADALIATNSFVTPDALSIKSAGIKAGNSFMVELPKHSVSVITLNVDR